MSTFLDKTSNTAMRCPFSCFLWLVPTTSPSIISCARKMAFVVVRKGRERNQRIDSATDDSPYDQGTVGLTANEISASTTVSFQDARLWTF